MFELLAFSNPYHGKTFFSFFVELFSRFILFLTGGLSFSELVTDEVQVGVLIGVAASSALVGSFLVLRKMTMLANSLSHTILMGIVLAYFFTVYRGSSEVTQTIAPMEAMLIASLIMGFVTAFLTEFLTNTGKLQEDASMGLVFTTFFALGIVLVTMLTRDAHIGIEAVMGNADALNPEDLKWVFLILIFNVVVISLFFKEYAITSFDPPLALALGISPIIFNYLLMAQVSATSITSFRAVGVLLVLAFMTGPVLCAKLLTKTLKSLIYLSIALGMGASLIGVALSRHFLTVYGMALSTSGVVVCVIFAFFILTVLYRKLLHRV